MPSPAKVLAGLAFALLPSLVAAQSTLGDLLDAGAKRLTVEDFKSEVVQHSLIGPSAWGGAQEIMYASNGTVHGSGSSPIDSPGTYRTELPISGEWKAGEGGTICTAMRITAGTGTSTTLPARCQVWFKLGQAYFVSDSDIDRRVAVLRRSIKALPAIAAAPGNLGQLLDAGALKISIAEFKRNVAQRVLVATMPNGAGTEIVYTIDGSIQGTAQPSPNYPWMLTVSGDWTVDGERVCTSMQFAGGTNPVRPVPRQCQPWFKLGDDYYVADSDSNRQAAVSRRSIKTVPARVAAPKDLGQLLDAGAKRMSADDFKGEVVQRLLSGDLERGEATELMYIATGLIQGRGKAGDVGFNPTIEAPLVGRWTIDGGGTVCSAVRIGIQTFPTRCQAWFKLGNDYFVADSDSDRGAKVLRRMVKP